MAVVRRRRRLDFDFRFALFGPRDVCVCSERLFDLNANGTGDIIQTFRAGKRNDERTNRCVYCAVTGVVLLVFVGFKF